LLHDLKGSIRTYIQQKARDQCTEEKKKKIYTERKTNKEKDGDGQKEDHVKLGGTEMETVRDRDTQQVFTTCIKLNYP